jgi:hypothetical protein
MFGVTILTPNLLVEDAANDSAGWIVDGRTALAACETEGEICIRRAGDAQGE